MKSNARIQGSEQPQRFIVLLLAFTCIVLAAVLAVTTGNSHVGGGWHKPATEPGVAGIQSPQPGNTRLHHHHKVKCVESAGHNRFDTLNRWSKPRIGTALVCVRAHSHLPRNPVKY